MKKLFLFIAAALILATTTVWAAQGEDVFETQRCGICHKPQTGKANPSLKDIAQAYQGKEELLTHYLNGEGEAVINPEKSKLMKRYVEKTKALSVEDRKALADFIMSHVR